ncbi:MAG: hypothetical protein ABUK01_07195 [Leptospirales bacterium]
MNITKKTFALITLFSFLIAPLALLSKDESVPLPDAPEGFTWESASEIQGALLKPDGWHFKKGKSKNSILYFITKEKFKKAPVYKTGFSLKMTPDIPELYKMKPTEYAAKVRENSSKNLVIEKTWDQKAGSLMLYGFQYLGYKNEIPIRAFVIFLANDKTGTIFRIMFESPEKDWDETWKKGETIINNMILDDEV